MSLYNQILGTHPFLQHLFALLGLGVNEDDEYYVGKIRDLYVIKIEDIFKIILYTRNGGPNRKSFSLVFKKLRSHPNYIKDYDCNIDNTYAYFEFSPPKDCLDIVQEIYDIAPEERGTKLFMRVCDNMRKGKKDPITNRALEVGKKNTETNFKW